VGARSCATVRVYVYVSLLEAACCNCLCCCVQGITAAILSDEGTNDVYIRVATIFGESVMSLLSDLVD
jgi:hypothetical protein